MSTAARSGRSNICKLLIDKGLWGRGDSLAHGVMMEIAAIGNKDVLNIILGERASSESSEKYFHIAKLYDAARYRKADAVRQLLKDQELPLDTSKTGMAAHLCISPHSMAT
ncbi:hypothetical protein BJY01DRAFT_121428 [Aspergillus pseudoustus]|uniref:Ankyrin repeat-containing domain protein n=1 Tax=Aspergillus pseudoustus TaxID=1810923 RepID=A0ABR4IQ64_9EURO